MILHGGGQRTICKSQASLPTTWVLGIRFRLWGFSKHLLFWVILPDLLQILKKCMLCNILKIRKKSLESWKKSYAIPKIWHLHLRLQPQGVLKHSFLQKVIPEASSGRTQGSHFIPDPCLTGLCNRLTVLTEVLVRPIWTLPHSITSQGDVNAAATVTEEMVAGAHTGAPCWWTSLRSQHCWESQHAPSVSMTRKRELKAGWRDRDNEEATQSWRNRLAGPSITHHLRTLRAAPECSVRKSFFKPLVPWILCPPLILHPFTHLSITGPLSQAGHPTPSRPSVHHAPVATPFYIFWLEFFFSK